MELSIGTSGIFMIYFSFCIYITSCLVAPHGESEKPANENNFEKFLIAKILQDPAERVIPESGNNEIENDSNIKEELMKRQSDMMEYGWGGGRFGKRSADIVDYGWGGGRFGKRYDPFSVGGRFGKRYDQYSVGGRFGKRGDEPEKKYDMFSVGGRFGKRYDQFSVGGRFGKRDGEPMKKYDMYSVGGRFGKRAGEGTKRYDMYSVGGRFGRDTAHLNKPETLGQEN